MIKPHQVVLLALVLSMWPCWFWAWLTYCILVNYLMFQHPQDTFVKAMFRIALVYFVKSLVSLVKSDATSKCHQCYCIYFLFYVFWWSVLCLQTLFVMYFMPNTHLSNNTSTENTNEMLIWNGELCNFNSKVLQGVVQWITNNDHQRIMELRYKCNYSATLMRPSSDSISWKKNVSLNKLKHFLTEPIQGFQQW